jgi:hypothetical protein
MVVVSDPDSQFGVHLRLVLRVGRGQHGHDVPKLDDQPADLLLGQRVAGDG